MVSLIKIGHTFLNIDRVLSVEDLYSTIKEDKVIIRFGGGEHDAMTFTGRDADDLRTWLNSRAINLHEATQNSGPFNLREGAEG